MVEVWNGTTIRPLPKSLNYQEPQRLSSTTVLHIDTETETQKGNMGEKLVLKTI